MIILQFSPMEIRKEALILQLETKLQMESFQNSNIKINLQLIKMEEVIIIGVMINHFI